MVVYWQLSFNLGGLQMKVSDVVGQRPLLEKLAKQEMRGEDAFKFAAFTREVLTALQEFETTRANLFTKYGEEITEGDKKGMKIKPENEEKFNAAIKRALDKKVKVSPFSLSTSEIKVSPAEIINAAGLFE
jgi:hypothetical protein